MSPRQLVTEFASNVLASFFGALLLIQLPGGFARRALSMAAIGIAAWLSISVSQWTWYGFSSAFVIGDLADQFGGWLLAGIAMASLLKPRRVRTF
jgi:O-antigen ligase